MNTIHVAAAAILNQHQQVLLSRRHPDSHQGDLWEFPGGKLEPGETVSQALERELREELGIQISNHRPLIRICHDYPDRRVLLDVHLVSSWQGDPRGLEGQPLRWVDAALLDNYPMPAADAPIVHALQLPPEYLITSPQAGDAWVFLHSLESALAQGVKLVQFRVSGLPPEQHRELAKRSLQLCREHGARMLVNQDRALVEELDTDGLHLKAGQLREFATRPLPQTKLLAASCHSLAELQQAQTLGVDFALLSPVLPTRSHPQAVPMGWDTFARCVEQINMPVYALGGMQLQDLQQAWIAGAQGVAGIGMWLNKSPQD